MATTQTQFAPAARDDTKAVGRQAGDVAAVKMLTQLLGVVPEILLVLNDKRQIVFFNQHLLRFLDCDDPKQVYGARPGEALKCIHSTETDGGCGTTASCRHCGMVLGILSSLEGKEAVQECRITRSQRGEALNLRIKSTPINVNGRLYVVLSAADISPEKRRESLEQVLFKEIGAVSAEIQERAADLRTASREQTTAIGGTLYQLSEQLTEGLNEHRLLTAAERDELYIRPAPFYSEELLRELVELYGDHEIAEDRALVVSADTKDAYMTSDRTLLKTVLAHMIRNALEACAPKEKVTVHTSPRDDRIEFRVHNPNPMPEAVRAQVFQRAFTTKGTGRGLGTYTMRLYSEKYLQGTVKLASTERVGTVFLASYPRELAT